MTAHNFSRRQLLKLGAAATVGFVSQRSSPAQELTALTTSATVINPIDAHVHVWNTDRIRYPLAAGFNTENLVPQSFTYDELFAETNPNGVNRIVLIQMNFYEFDNSYMLDAIAKFPERFRGVAIIDETKPEAPELMHSLLRQGVTGFRLYAQKEHVNAWQSSADMNRMWEVAADTRQAICLLSNPDSLPGIATLCEMHPGTRVVIDHFSRIGVDGEIRDSDLDNLCALAKFPNVFVKTSAFYALGKKKSPYSDLGTMIRRLRDSFGAERLMWASDSPFQVVEGHMYQDSLQLIQEKLDFLSLDDKLWMLEKTAENIYWF